MKNFESLFHKDFYTNEAKRTVVCVLSLKNDFFVKKFISNKISEFLPQYAAHQVGYAISDDEKVNKVRTIYKGKAKCDPADEWNEEFGKKLALDRALSKAECHFVQTCHNLSQLFGEMSDSFAVTFKASKEEDAEQSEKETVA